MRYLLLMLCLSISLTTTYAQGNTPSLNPEDTLSFINLKLSNPDGTPYANSPVVLKGAKGHLVNVTTRKDGTVKAKVPFDETYTVHCGEHTCMRSIAVSDFPYVTYNFQAYTQRFIYLVFTYKTPSDRRLQDEVVRIYSSTGKTYTDTTNAGGKAVFWLPFEPEFRIAVKYHDTVKIIRPIDVGKEYKKMTVEFTWMGSKGKEYYAYLLDSFANVQRLATLHFLDSVIRTGHQIDLSKEDIYIPIGHDSVEWVSRALEVKATAYKNKLKESPKFLEEKKQVILAPLYRLRNRFKNKLIVMDISNAMYGYKEQLMLWHAMDLRGDGSSKSETGNSRYLFFNGGDGKEKKPEEKVIGSTKGFYSCEGQLKDFNTIINTMREGIANRSGIWDPSSNDIEALLEAKKSRKKYDEIFLIANNYSSIKDLKLMKQLNVPIRIIVCGSENPIIYSCRKVYYKINEEYLNLAHATNGSIHLMEEDIYDLSKIKEGGSITIQGQTYDFINGRFVQQYKVFSPRVR